MVHLLILGGLLEVLGLRLSSPHNVPFRAVRANDAEACRLQRVDYRVVDMCCLTDFETKHHVVLLEVLLSGDLHLLELAKVRLRRPA